MPPSNLSRSLNRFFLLLAFVAAIGSSARAQETVTTPTGSKLVVTVKPEKTHILPGEPIEVAVEYRFLKPQGGMPDSKWSQDVWPYVDGQVSIAVFNRDGKRLDERTSSSKDILSFTGGREVFTRTFFLPDWVRLKEPGTFRIRVETEFSTQGPNPNEDEPARESLFQVAGEGFFEVLPQDDNRLAGLIQETGERALKTDVNPAWKRLFAIEDPRVVPFLVLGLNRLGSRPVKYRPTHETPTSSEIRRSTGNIQTVSKSGIILNPGGLRPLVLSGYKRPKPITSNPELSEEVCRLIETLAYFKTDEAMTALARASHSPFDDVRESVAQNLLTCAHPKALPLLLAMRNDRSYKVRMAVAEALSNDSFPETMPFLQNLLRDRDYEVSNAARKSLDARTSNGSK